MTLRKYTISFHPQVELDYYNSYCWYETQQKGLGERFLFDVRKKLDSIVHAPKTFGFKGKSQFREAIVDDFPYIIVYKVYEKLGVIFVSSIHHAKKHPAKKYRKL